MTQPSVAQSHCHRSSNVHHTSNKVTSNCTVQATSFGPKCDNPKVHLTAQKKKVCTWLADMSQIAGMINHNSGPIQSMPNHNHSMSHVLGATVTWGPRAGNVDFSRVSSRVLAAGSCHSYPSGAARKLSLEIMVPRPIPTVMLSVPP